MKRDSCIGASLTDPSRFKVSTMRCVGVRETMPWGYRSEGPSIELQTVRSAVRRKVLRWVVMPVMNMKGHSFDGMPPEVHQPNLRLPFYAYGKSCSLCFAADHLQTLFPSQASTAAAPPHRQQGDCKIAFNRLNESG